jgi:short-subunit dehydrogenase
MKCKFRWILGKKDSNTRKKYMNLKNKVCWITGASSGIGEGIAKELAKEGAKIVLSARKVDDLNRVNSALNLPASQTLVLPMDMLEHNKFPEKINEIIQKFGAIDYVFHNAGISQRGMMKDTPVFIDRQVMELNFMSVIELTKAVLPQMFKQNSGYFVVTSSIAGKVGTPMRSAYCASKHALHGYFDALRAELWPQNIGVSLICPGYIKTNISLNAVGSHGEKFGKMDKNQEQGMPVEKCASKIISAVKAGKREVYIGGKEVLAVYLKRFFPSILARIVKNYKIESV